MQGSLARLCLIPKEFAYRCNGFKNACDNGEYHVEDKAPRPSENRKKRFHKKTEIGVVSGIVCFANLTIIFIFV